MPLPLKTFKVFPNPWALIHHELGPQGACPTDNGGRDEGPLRFVGATREVYNAEVREGLKVGSLQTTDPRGNRGFARFCYGGLSQDLLGGMAVEVSAKSGYYRQRLEQGDLVPADERTAKAVKCKFADLKAAKAVAVASFDADHGDGSWKELEAELGGGKPAPSAAAAKSEAEQPATSSGEKKGKS